MRFVSAETGAAVRFSNRTSRAPIGHGPLVAAGGASSDAGGPAFDAGGPAFDAGSPAFNAGGPAFDVGGPAFDVGGPAFDVAGAVRGLSPGCSAAAVIFADVCR